MSVIQFYLTENKDNYVVLCVLEKGRLFEEIIKNSTYMYFDRSLHFRWFFSVYDTYKRKAG